MGRPQVHPHNTSPDVIGAGSATVLGTNSSEAAFDQLGVGLELTGPEGSVEAATFLTYVQPGEEIAQWVPVLDDSAGTDLTCEVTEVTPASYGSEVTLDPEGGTCEVAQQGPTGYQAQTDLSGIEGIPADEDRFVGIIWRVDGKRHGLDEAPLRAGETTLTSTTQSEAPPTCAVRYLRDL